MVIEVENVYLTSPFRLHPKVKEIDNWTIIDPPRPVEYWTRFRVPMGIFPWLDVAKRFDTIEYEGGPVNPMGRGSWYVAAKGSVREG